MEDTRTIDYPQLVLHALRDAIGRILREVARDGLPGAHHFYITFRTDAPGVVMPPSLRRKYPEEITIVLQNQFWDLQADDIGFAVTLRFGGDPVMLEVPYAAMTAFADPSAEFGIQLAEPGAAEAGAEGSAEGPAEAEPPTEPGTVIEFDANRRRD